MKHTTHIAYLSLSVLCFAAGALIFNDENSLSSSSRAIALEESNNDNDRETCEVVTGLDNLPSATLKNTASNIESDTARFGQNTQTNAEDNQEQFAQEASNEEIGSHFDDEKSPGEEELSDIDELKRLHASLGIPLNATSVDQLEINPASVNELESRLIFSDKRGEEQVTQLYDYLNHYQDDMSEEFFPMLLESANFMEPSDQVEVIKVVTDSFWDLRSQKSESLRQKKISSLRPFINSENEEVRVALLTTLAGTPGNEAMVDEVITQFRNDPSERIRAIAVLVEDELEAAEKERELEREG